MPNDARREMNASRCLIHGRNMKPIAEGYFEYPEGRHRQSTVDACMTLTDAKEEVMAEFYRRKLHPKFRRRHTRELQGRYCAVSKAGTVHVCECRFTKEDKEEGKRLAERFEALFTK